MSVTNPKELAGRAAAELVRDGMRVGLGTGSTVHFTLLRLAERIRAERLRITGVPTSDDTERKARELGIPLVELGSVERLDLTIDGADEIDGRFDMIKGGGGALLREKVVASISAREAIVVGEDKVVERLGVRFKLPVEVVPFAAPVVERALTSLGAKPALRKRADGATFVSDNHNWILDCAFAEGIADAERLDRALKSVPGVVETGLFLGLAHVLFVGCNDGRVVVREK
ncbi:MAG: ribose-5-phosphate isomerase RpiA [Planctomycetes bacterium]|nr:ribose-5-phosphate isomerase RpiA [Planctomycetota bacterium]